MSVNLNFDNLSGIIGSSAGTVGFTPGVGTTAARQLTWEDELQVLLDEEYDPVTGLYGFPAETEAEVVAEEVAVESSWLAPEIVLPLGFLAYASYEAYQSYEGSTADNPQFRPLDVGVVAPFDTPGSVVKIGQKDNLVVPDMGKPDMGKSSRVSGSASAATGRGVVKSSQMSSRAIGGVKKPAGVKRVRQSHFGPVSSITTAPVAIGNSITGCDPIVIPQKDGVRVKGRDYLFGVDATAASITGWTLTGGVPLTPSALVSSALKGFSNTYAEYMVHGLAFHFITAESTGNNGSVLLYIGKDRAGPGLNPTSANMLPFVLSDHCTVLPPIWKNCSASYYPPQVWYTTGLGNDEGLHEQCCGELFALTRVAVDTSPGYILMDFDITFRTMQTNIKNLTFPITRMKYNQVAIYRSSLAAVANTTAFSVQIVQSGGVGTLMDGTTASANPVGTKDGDIFKVILNTAASSLTNATLSNLVSYSVGGVNQTVTLTDGFTMYGVAYNTSGLELYPTYLAASTNGDQYTYGVTATVTFNFPAYISLVGSLQAGILQANY